MFNLGNGDKEKLEENMEEIRNQVKEESINKEEQGGGERENQRTSKDNEQAQERQQSSKKGKSSQPTLDDSSFQQTSEEEINADKKNLVDALKDRPSVEKRENAKKSPEKRQADSQENSPEIAKNNSNTGSKTSESNTEKEVKKLDESLESLREEVERQMEEKEKQLNSVGQHETTEYEKSEVDESEATLRLSKMSAEGNSLFLEVKKFEKVKNLVREMRNLSHEMGTVMDDLDERTDKAGGTEQEAQSLLNEFAERRDELERAVSDEK